MVQRQFVESHFADTHLVNMHTHFVRRALGLYHKTFQIRNLLEKNRIISKLVPSGLEKHVTLDKRTSLLRSLFITNP